MYTIFEHIGYVWNLVSQVEDTYSFHVHTGHFINVCALEHKTNSEKEMLKNIYDEIMVSE